MDATVYKDFRVRFANCVEAGRTFEVAIDDEHLRLVVRRALRERTLQDEVIFLREQLHNRFAFRDVISKSPRMHGVFELISNVAHTTTTVLVEDIFPGAASSGIRAPVAFDGRLFFGACAPATGRWPERSSGVRATRAGSASTRRSPPSPDPVSAAAEPG